MSKARTRFAPSPTGYMHIGNLRTALYAYLLTKSMGGDFILRIEDTDQERYVEGATDVIYNTLKETGLIWDEGPDIGGNYGPYIQSERKHLYKGMPKSWLKADMLTTASAIRSVLKECAMNVKCKSCRRSTTSTACPYKGRNQGKA